MRISQGWPFKKKFSHYCKCCTMQNTSISVHSYETAQQATREAGKIITKILREQHNRPVLLLSSGGSTLDILEQVTFPEKKEMITLSVLDERLSQDSLVNNFSRLVTLPFFHSFVVSGGKSIDTRMRSGDSVFSLSNRFETALRRWKRDYPQGIILITQGIGTDGHTAGIMPFPENPELFKTLFDDPKRWVVGYDAGIKNPYSLRVTVTITFLREMVDCSIVFIAGENKASLLKNFLQHQEKTCDAPLYILKEMRKVVIVTDIR